MILAPTAATTPDGVSRILFTCHQCYREWPDAFCDVCSLLIAPKPPFRPELIHVGLPVNNSGSGATPVATPSRVKKEISR